MAHMGAALEGARTFVRLGLLLLLVLTPLPFGSVSSRSVLLIEWAAAILGGLALGIQALDPDSALRRRGSRLLLAAGAVALVGASQLVPIGPALARHTVEPTAEARDAVAAELEGADPWPAPASLEPPATLDALLRWVAYLLIGLAAAVAFTSVGHARLAAWTLAAAAAFQGLYGASEYLSGHQHIFGYAKQYFLDEATGTFINRNHYAGYLAIALPVTACLFVDAWRKAPRDRGWRERLLRWGEPRGLVLPAAALATALIWLGVVLSYSRGGLAAAVGGLLFLGLRMTRRRAVWGILVVLLVPTVLLLGQELRAPGERFVADEEEIASVSGRLPVWEASWGMALDYLPLGSGLGTFEGAFQLYRPPEVQKHWDHAHNDWLQALVEGGPLVVLALGWILWIAVRGRRGREPHPLALGVGAGLVAIALHSLVDFSLRMPAIAVLSAFLVGLSCRLPWSPRKPSPVRS